MIRKFSDEEIEVRTHRLDEARRIRSEMTRKKDKRFLIILGENDGSTITDLMKNTVYKRSYMCNALRRLDKQGKITKKEEIYRQKLRYRWFVSSK